ncbi:MAG: phenylalanine--tRNA ligase subunit alpha [Methylococcales bacterium]|jgi:phenylalanyl-tRNA synthetase alpha chain|nr:phenylalanine--tRNA ligase subunit alpha [Methylococcales bacterium]MBT7409276.1 phenylalanine--tRNA ligase subunit alpha [Methylococcales bacterium]
MIEALAQLETNAVSKINDCLLVDDLEKIRVELVGKKGELTQMLKNLKSVAPELRRECGQKANQLKNKLMQSIEDKKQSLLDSVSLVDENFDLSLPGTSLSAGGLHPITRMTNDLNDAFQSLGFEIYEGPEVSSELYEFDNLNFPSDHPARESMDTYWLESSDDQRICLRPHLTGTSVRYMQSHKPPFRFVYPGRVYRNETTDPRHERAFFQYEALIVDESIPFSSGQLLVKTILDRVFGQSVKVRMRSGFFPFVEPGFEIDMQCLVCGGDGCRVCKQVGWLEVMPGGPPHPNVLKAGGIDPEKWTGFYINIGLDRLVMMRDGVNDVRLFHSADLRFLSQYK